MAITINTPSGQTVDRELMVAYLNTGTAQSPVWSPIGKRVEDSSVEMDWQTETRQDILGATYTTGKKPTKTQTFDPCEVDSGDAAQAKIYDAAIVKNDVGALLNMDLLIVHYYTTDGAETAPESFAERYPSSAILPTSIGGEGGGALSMPIDVTYGGARSVGTAARSSAGVVTFTPAIT